jgi:hypothetical protein
MDKHEILKAAGEQFGLDEQETDLALRYAAAAKEALQRALTVPLEEAERLKGRKRLRSLMLDLYQRQKAAVLLPRVLEDERQCHLADQLVGTHQQIRKLESKFGLSVTDKGPLIKKADAQRMAYRRAHRELITPATHRRVSGEAVPHLP